MDSARWAGYRPRSDDIVISTFPKCGATWMQRIVSMLLAGSAAPAPVAGPWFDFRLRGPVEPMLEQAEAIVGRRHLKSHLRFDSLPVYEGVKFIHVARDGRDSAMSWHNHVRGYHRRRRTRSSIRSASTIQSSATGRRPCRRIRPSRFASG